jgi:hypothetical protein
MCICMYVCMYVYGKHTNIYMCVCVCVCVCIREIYTLSSDRTLQATAGAKVCKAVALFQRVTVRILALKRTET